MHKHDHVEEAHEEASEIAGSSSIEMSIQGDEVVTFGMYEGHSGSEMSPRQEHEKQGKQDEFHESGRKIRLRWTNPSALEVLDESQECINDLMKKLYKEDHQQFTPMTFSRRIVEKYLLNHRWYNPQLEAAKVVDSAPDLSLAWAFFEHITLPRRLVSASNTTSRFERAEPGEVDQPTALYSPWSLPESELSQWGIAMGLYFATLRILCTLFLVLGCLNLVNVFYFSSQAYSKDEQGQSNLSLYLKGTAICTNRQWVPCPNCESWQWVWHPTAFATNEASGMNFVQRNACANGATRVQGMINYVSILFMILSLLALGFYQKRLARKLDEDVLSATDYSLCVRNPPPDARDPEKWRDFFNQFESNNKQVVAVTIALKNGILINSLLQRRRMRKQLRIMLGSDLNLDDKHQVRNSILCFNMKVPPQDDAYIPPSSAPEGPCSKITELLRNLILKPFGLAYTPEESIALLENLENKIRTLQKLEYPVVKVFVTFETEAGQRNALAALTVSKSSSWFNLKNTVPSTALFHGKVLEVIQPKEPNSIRWTDLGVATWIKVTSRISTASFILGLIALDVFIIYISRKNLGPQFAAIMISLFNFFVPLFSQFINAFEPHSADESYQTSLFFKMVSARWINTVFVATIITPFTRTLTDGERDLLPQVGILLFYELWLTPLLRYSDMWGNFLKHFWAPRCRTQEGMNSCFQGTVVSLAERYTDFMRILLLVCFYSPIYPSAFMFGAAVLIIQYWMDKFCLVRSWARQAMIGGKLAAFIRTYFFSTLIVIWTVSASYFWSGFSFDNVCESLDSFSDTGSVSVTLGSGEHTLINVDSTYLYKYCLQDLFKTQGTTYPPLSSRQPQNSQWMTIDQAFVTDIVGWTSFVILIAWALWVFGGTATRALLSVFKGTYREVSKDMEVDFSKVSDINAYVPQITVPDMNYPLIICDIDNVDPGLVGWRDSRNGYDKHNMFFDLPREARMRRVRSVNEEGLPIDVANRDMFLADEEVTQSQKIFSVVKHWPRVSGNQE